jgi:hypothetical protein
MAGSADAGVEKTSPQRLLRSHLTLVLTLIPIVLSAMRFCAVANGDRATLVRQLSALDVKSTLLGTFVWLLPTAFGVVAAMCWIRWACLRAAPNRPPQLLAGDRDDGHGAGLVCVRAG